MKERMVGLFWGVVLIVVGGWFLITGNTSFVIRDPYLGMALTGSLSVLFFASYALSGPRRWGWLFPACIFAGVTVTAGLSTLPVAEGGWIAAPVLIGVAVPFVVAYFQEPEKRRWALIPAYVMGAVTLVASFADVLPDEWMGTLVLLAIALPFLVVYLNNRARQWALIVCGVLVVISILPAMTAALPENAAGIGVMFLFAVAFTVVYVTRPRNWWALIPAGFFATIGVVVLVVEGGASGDISDWQAERLVAGVLFLGWGLTFLGVWLRRSTAPTRWAIYPAALLGALAVGAFVGGPQVVNYLGPVMIIAVGVLVLYNSYRSKSQ